MAQEVLGMVLADYIEHEDLLPEPTPINQISVEENSFTTLKEELQKVVDWNLIDKADYLFAMERSLINDLEIRYLISNALTDKIDDRELYMKGIDVSYFYEGYSVYTIDDL